MPCIFCQIVAGEVPSEVLYQDDEVIAIRDIAPQAPVHIMVVPKRDIASLADVAEDQVPLMGRLVAVASLMAKREGISESGYRLALNCGPDADQVVPHVHLHLLGGRQLTPEMG